MGHLRILTAAVMFLAAALSASGVIILPALAEDSPAPAGLDRDPNAATLVYARDGWLVWVEVDPADPNDRTVAPRHSARYYRQKLGHAESVLILDMRRYYHRSVLAVLEDGTVLLASDSQLTWIRPDGTGETEVPEVDGQEVRIVEGFADGVLMQPKPVGGKAPVYFVPIRGGALDLGGKLAVAVDDGVSFNNLTPFLAAGDLLAWGRFVYDLNSKSRRELPIAGYPIVTAFDGATLVHFTAEGHLATSIADGTTKLVDKPSGPLVPSRVLAIRNRIGYFLDYEGIRPTDGPDHLLLKAIALFEPQRGAVEVARLPVTGERQGPFVADIPRIETDQGLIVWDGQRWRTVPWLESVEGRSRE